MLAPLLIFAHLLALAPLARAAFSGEDLLGPDDPLEPGAPVNWHHQGMTADAARAAGFAPEVAKLVAWHADYVDSYAYNPLWWAKGGVARAKVALATRGELAKLHFDDLTSGDQVRRAWRRYLGGTAAGLMWAAGRGDVAAARNVLGAALHALQDFYSHSNWVDAPERRGRTWFDVPPAERARLALWTGTYELPDHLGVAPHGKVAPWCAALNRPGVAPVLEVACSVFSPLNKSSLCEHWRRCQAGQAVRPPSVLGVPIPENVVYLAPPGIALDNTWTAAIGAQRRGVTDVPAPELFAAAKRLATATSARWLQELGAVLQRHGAGAFWERVKTEAPAGAREREFEGYARLPYLFLTAGPYPPDLGETGEEWYLRVRLRTAPDGGAGTDADVYLHAGGRAFLLDYLPGANPLVAYNDFEAGDDTAYTVGPFPARPGALALENRSADAGEVLRALGRAFVEAVGGAVAAVGDFLLSLIAGHADVVGVRQHLWQAAELGGVGAAPQAFEVPVDGGDEGLFVVHGWIRRTGEGPGASPADDWAEYEVHLERLHCVRESRWDRGSSSDETFVLAVLAPLPGEVQPYRTDPYRDVDSGETRGIGHSFGPVRVPKSYGALSLGITVMESDDEGAGARDRLLDEFANRVAGETDPARRDFVTALGAAVGADWKLAHLEVYAFTRGGGGVVRGGTVLDAAVNRWIRGGERAEFALGSQGLSEWRLDLLTSDAAPTLSLQDRWRWCHKCRGLWFGGSPATGRCPADGGPHAAQPSGNYALVHNSALPGGWPGGFWQDQWRWCHKCLGLWHGGSTPAGRCPADGGPHAAQPSGNYALAHGSAPPGEWPGGWWQGGWRWCHKCRGLWHGGSTPAGRCPADGGPHAAQPSGNYFLFHKNG